MKESDITKVLSSMRGEADAPTHRRALRRSLLSHASASRPRVFITIFMTKKYFIPAGLMAAVLVGTLVLNPGGSAVAQAQEQANRAYARAIAISPAMRAELEAKMKADMLETLAEAKAAPDLRVLTKEEFEKESPFSISHGPAAVMVAAPAEWSEGVPAGEAKEAKTIAYSNAAGTIDPTQENVTFTVSASAVPPAKFTGVMTTGTVVAGAPGEGFSEPVKYLSYTDPRGNKTVLGLDKNDTPVFKFSQINSADIMQMGDGMIGIKGEAVQVIKLQEAQ